MRPRSRRSFLAESTCEPRASGPDGTGRRQAWALPREVSTDPDPLRGTWDSGPAPQRLPEAGEEAPQLTASSRIPRRAGEVRSCLPEAPGP